MLADQPATTLLPEAAQQPPADRAMLVLQYVIAITAAVAAFLLARVP